MGEGSVVGREEREWRRGKARMMRGRWRGAIHHVIET